MVRDFDKMWQEAERSHKRVSTMAAVIMALTWVVVIAMIVGMIYVGLHPELIGQFAGKIVDGFTAARN